MCPPVSCSGNLIELSTDPLSTILLASVWSHGKDRQGNTMKLHYYPETDSLYVEFRENPGAETREVADGVRVDLDARGHVVGFDIDHASIRLDLFTLEANGLPLRSYRIA